MSLKGTLKDFSVADIFQLIGQQGKSGSLYIRNTTNEAQIIFDRGRVVMGSFRRGQEDLLLGTILLRAQVITSDQLSEAMQDQKTTMRSLGDILRRKGIIDNQTLGEFISLQLKEVLFRLFQWKDGLYEFSPSTIKFSESVIKPQSTEAVLMDGFRMLDEWPKIEERVESLDMIFKPLVDATSFGSNTKADEEDDDLNIDAAFSAFDDPPNKASKSDPKLSGGEKLILRLLDETTPLYDICFRSRLGIFETCKIVASLLDRGVVEKFEKAESTRADADLYLQSESVFSVWLTRSIKPIILAFLLSFMIPFLSYGIRSNVIQIYGTPLPDRGKIFAPGLTLNDLIGVEERDQIQQVLEIYRLENNTYPSSLSDLNMVSFSKNWDYQRLSPSVYVLLQSR